MAANIEKARRKAAALIKEAEGLRLLVYRCPAGHLTGGWGHRTDRPINSIIKLSEAEQWLREDMAGVLAQIGQDIVGRLNTNQLAAIWSLVFNIGGGAFASSTLLKMILAGNMAGAAAQILLWNKATVAGRLVVLTGLSNRREAENTLFLCERDL